MESTLAKIKHILKQEIGLDASTIGAATIDKILNERMKCCNISKLDAYFDYLSNTPKELHLLLETSVIPETWFFRDDKPFQPILNSVSRQLVHNPDKKCKILCIPCSTGEEPYSISIFLHDNGIPKSAYEIHAVDVSHKSIAIAKQGIYTSNSFRGEKSKLYSDRYFTKKDTEFALNDSIKSCVNFSQLNILDPDSLVGFKFDFILCRNLLIYFDVPTKEKAYNNLSRLLSDNGMLFIGHSEFGSVPKNLFKVVKHDSVFCLVKTSTDDIDSIPVKNFKPKARKKAELSSIQPPEKLAFSDSSKFSNEKQATIQLTQEKTKNVHEKVSSQLTSDELIKQARKLADASSYNEAESLCLEYIDEYGDHEDTFFLLGLISEASGDNEQAQNFYKKALYMNPKHYETLIHLSYIIESQGDIEGARLLKERAERAVKK